MQRDFSKIPTDLNSMYINKELVKFIFFAVLVSISFSYANAVSEFQRKIVLRNFKNKHTLFA